MNKKHLITLSMAGILVLSLGTVAHSVAAEEEEGQNPMMNFIGDYAAGRAQAHIECTGMEGGQITINWGSSAWENTEWIMTGVLDTDTLTLDYTDGIRTDYVYDEDGNETGTIVYENGSGSFQFDEDLTFTWTDEMEDAGKDLVFEWSFVAPDYTFTTEDGVLTIEAPSAEWAVQEDEKHWFVISDGDDMITIDHLRNGENLPSVSIADEDYEAVYHAFVSTKDEVFVVKAAAVEAESLENLMRSVGTIQINEFGTKTALEAAETESAFIIQAVNEKRYVTVGTLNVREGYSAESRRLGTLVKGTEVEVTGIVMKDGKDYGWSQIKFNGGTAYVSSQFLTATKPEEAAATPTPTPATTPEAVTPTPAAEPENPDAEPAVEPVEPAEPETPDAEPETEPADEPEAEPEPEEPAEPEYDDEITLINRDRDEIKVYHYVNDPETVWHDEEGHVYNRREGMAPLFIREDDESEWSDHVEYWEEVEAAEAEQQNDPEGE